MTFLGGFICGVLASAAVVVAVGGWVLYYAPLDLQGPPWSSHTEGD